MADIEPNMNAPSAGMYMTRPSVTPTMIYRLGSVSKISLMIGYVRYAVLPRTNSQKQNKQGL